MGMGLVNFWQFSAVKRFQVHDSFWTHAGDVPMLNKSIRDWEGDSNGWSKAGLRSFIPFDGRDTKNVAEKWGWRWLATFRWCFNKVDSWIFVGAPNVPERNLVDEKTFFICEWFASQNRKMFNKFTSHELRCFCSNIQSSIIQPLRDPMTFLSKSSQFSTKSRKPLWNSMRNLCCRTSMRPAGRYADIFVYFFECVDDVLCSWYPSRLAESLVVKKKTPRVFWEVLAGVTRLPILEDQRMQQFGSDMSWLNDFSEKECIVTLFVILL